MKKKVRSKKKLEVKKKVGSKKPLAEVKHIVCRSKTILMENVAPRSHRGNEINHEDKTNSHAMESQILLFFRNNNFPT